MAGTAAGTCKSRQIFLMEYIFPFSSFERKVKGKESTGFVINYDLIVKSLFTSITSTKISLIFVYTLKSQSYLSTSSQKENI